jgi:hypothetical protein
MSTDEMAGCVANHVAEEFGLNFTVQSLETVDSVLDNVKDWMKDWSKAGKNMIVISLGCYVGEILIREMGGRWCSEEEFTPPLSNAWIEIPSESRTITANPFIRCQKRFKNGKADGVAVWAKLLLAMHKKPMALPVTSNANAAVANSKEAIQ